MIVAWGRRRREGRRATRRAKQVSHVAVYARQISCRWAMARGCLLQEFALAVGVSLFTVYTYEYTINMCTAYGTAFYCCRLTAVVYRGILRLLYDVMMYDLFRLRYANRMYHASPVLRIFRRLGFGLHTKIALCSTYIRGRACGYAKPCVY